jgi:hypothetical protein
MQPSFGHAQIAAHGNRGDIQGLGDFFHGESAEIAEFDGFAFSRVELFEGIQTSVEGQEVSAAFGLKTDGFIERHFEPSALTGLLAARVVHQNLAHESGSHSKEMRAALPGGIALIDKPYVSLVNERGWLQCMALVFLAQVAGGKLAEFAVNEGSQVIEGLLVSLRPSGQQKGHFVGFGHGPRVENGTLPSWADYTPPSLPCLSFAR